MDEPTSPPDPLTELILEVFRVNGRLIAAGDELVAPLGLTSARWQVLGAIALAAEPTTVAGLARSMGLTRQSVQRIINELASDQVVRLVDNPQHRRAKRVVFTSRGEALVGEANKRQAPWARALSEHFEPSLIAKSTACLRALRERLDADPSAR
jgi:DNA-binding MarR family transcriptional regulator